MCSDTTRLNHHFGLRESYLRLCNTCHVRLMLWNQVKVWECPINHTTYEFSHVWQRCDPTAGYLWQDPDVANCTICQTNRITDAPNAQPVLMAMCPTITVHTAHCKICWANPLTWFLDPQRVVGWIANQEVRLTTRARVAYRKIHLPNAITNVPDAQQVSSLMADAANMLLR